MQPPFLYDSPFSVDMKKLVNDYLNDQVRSLDSHGNILCGENYETNRKIEKVGIRSCQHGN